MRRLGVLGLAAWAVAWLANRSLRRVEGTSMLPTLWPNDLLVTVPPPWAGGLRRDDVVVADTPSGVVTKRLAGLPGEAVLVGEGHRHAAGTWHRLATTAGDAEHRFQPRSDEVVLLGDHPGGSTDSRSYGPVPMSTIQRVALARVRPWVWLRARRPRPLAGPRRRPTVRVITFDPDDRVLLFEVQDTDGSGMTWWETPGGGMEPGEDVIETARRELVEEVGQVATAVVDLDRVIERTTPRAGAELVKVEHLAAARLPDTSVDPAGWTRSEVRDTLNWRWWTAEELGASGDRVAPAGLVDVLPEARDALG